LPLAAKIFRIKTPVSEQGRLTLADASGTEDAA
jgi:hypothetical protein